jgi:hypothetical protein
VYLVLCFDGDLPAFWAHERLRDAGVGPLELVTAASLAFAKTWEHRLGFEGVQTNVELEDGRILRSSQIKGVLNRLAASPQYVVDHAIAEDREYAGAESGAFYLSWLNALPHVINRPTPQGLPGAWRHASEWAVLAASAGLNTPPYRQSSASHPEDGFVSLAPPGRPVFSVIVLRGELYGSAVTSAVGQACRRLAESAGTDLLGVDLFDAGDGDLAFAHATPFPVLTLGGDDLIDGLARALRAEDE